MILVALAAEEGLAALRVHLIAEPCSLLNSAAPASFTGLSTPIPLVVQSLLVLPTHLVSGLGTSEFCPIIL